MAIVTTVSKVDDIDGSASAESVSFGLDGVVYEIDLGAKNAQKLRDALATYVAHARKVSGRRVRTARAARSRPAAASNRDQTTAIRAWARANGYEVSDRGRLPATVMEAFEAAH